MSPFSGTPVPVTAVHPENIEPGQASLVQGENQLKLVSKYDLVYV